MCLLWEVKMLTFKLKACFSFKVLNCLTAYNKRSPSCHSTNGGSDKEIGAQDPIHSSFPLYLVYFASCLMCILHFFTFCTSPKTNTCQTKTKQIYNPLTWNEPKLNCQNFMTSFSFIVFHYIGSNRQNPTWGQAEVISLSLLKYNLQYARPKQV